MQSETKKPTGGRLAGAESAAASSALLDVRAVAELLQCSARHVYRLSDGGRMPPPRKLGALVRWSARDIESWIADGCPAVRTAKGARP
jgi:excisionase family DNA binding protein